MKRNLKKMKGIEKVGNKFKNFKHYPQQPNIFSRIQLISRKVIIMPQNLKCM